MKKKNKLFLSVLAAVLATICLIGCSVQDPTQQTLPTQATTLPQPTTPPEKATVTFQSVKRSRQRRDLLYYCKGVWIISWG